MTVSVGLAYKEIAENIFDSESYISDLSTKADDALYEAKSAGRNRIQPETSASKPAAYRHKLRFFISARTDPKATIAISMT